MKTFLILLSQPGAAVTSLQGACLLSSQIPPQEEADQHEGQRDATCPLSNWTCLSWLAPATFTRVGPGPPKISNGTVETCAPGKHQQEGQTWPLGDTTMATCGLLLPPGGPWRPAPVLLPLQVSGPSLLTRTPRAFRCRLGILLRFQAL